MKGPLDGIKVVEWAVWGFGPMAGAILGDLGAQVVKIEHPQGGDPSRGLQTFVGVDCELPAGRNAMFEVLNHHKRSVTINVSHPKGKELVLRLVRGADVFIQNFRPGAAERLGIGYDVLSKVNPRLIYASGSGYGALGPDAHRPGLDYVGQARSGIMWTTGHPGGPPYWSTYSAADSMGGIVLALGIITAIAARAQYGVGQKIEVSHLGATMFLEYWAIGVSLLTGIREWPRLDRRMAPNPLWNHYRCVDGEWIGLALVQSDRFWRPFCKTLKIEHLADDARFCDSERRKEHCSELTEILDGVFATKTRSEWERVLIQNPDFVFDRVQKLTDLPNDPQVVANEYISEVDHPELGRVKVLNFPVKMEKTPARVPSAAPGLGEHTEEILAELGVSNEEIVSFRVDGVI